MHVMSSGIFSETPELDIKHIIQIVNGSYEITVHFKVSVPNYDSA